ncbi:hypothetical protein AAZX31_13G353800 [Glycine max]|uniref:DUF3754 domain-containing protein n=1 Tax=Glycine max TaxID=3847 RepID=I1M618_SOYBN|nr:uncharacterized protein LOC100809560 [Glycine max]KAG4961698.1 hypothetical protein JHK87_038331 [Glycine soja]KAG4979092.1 hypothetical protein JHK86_038566 [Glycine max]KAH1105372.1 hypothetical protein GYH30_038569 [Glycine max]KAH1105373.1 hypothetical protein GYH30_038569 [Glycine max]KAH1105374.1 hypothetical protein GYH30_038569 [Glycine max]|eukprot:XP_003543724.1 uncharacterized protein LOC100809560 [Glycine max]
MSYCWQIHTLASKALVPIPQSQSQSLFFPYSHSHSSICVGLSRRVPCSRLQEMSVVESSSQYQYQQQQQQSTTTDYYPSVRDDEEGEGISKIRVPRQKHIPVSKSQLLDAIILSIQDDIDAHHFRLLTSCLDSILHAEHKTILEEMRSDYQLTDSLQQLVSNPNVKEEGNLYDYQPALDLTALLRSLDIPTKKDYDTGSRVTIATRFQRAFMQLLSNAQFEELSARDLMLTSALNTDYLLTLPIYVDWKRAYESNAIIFRRGYATEKQKGLLIVEKLDYLQSKFLRRTFFAISEPLTKLGTWISELYENACQKHEVQNWTERLRLWLKELSLFQKSLLYNDPASDEQIGVDQVPNAELPIWLAAQRAVARYEGILSPVGPRGRLLRRLLSWIGLIPPMPETPFEVHNDNNAPEPYLRPTFLSRISLSDIWRPASRKYCRNDTWKMLKTSISILFSQSVLQEPAFEELILLYTKEVEETNAKDKAEVPSLQLKIYERIPIPDLPVIFPHKKLSFRIIDTVRLDVATILGLLAYFINYKFENVLSSPSAILLDVVAVSALIIYGSRVVLGYKQTWDRYQLLVNKTLYEKTLASGFGSVHFLLDASEQQQYKEAILAYAILLKAEKSQVISRQSVGEKCERFMYEVFKVKVEMPIDKALNTLLRLGLATESSIDGRRGLLAMPCPKAYEALKERWNSLLS